MSSLFPTFLCPTHTQADRYERTGICKSVNASLVFHLFLRDAGALRLLKMSPSQPQAQVTASDKEIVTSFFYVTSVLGLDIVHLLVEKGTDVT
jgi:hypothetical protein